MTSLPPRPQESGGTVLVERPVESVRDSPLWTCVVWDDPVNLMSYVTHVFESYFGYPRAKAERLMLQVHHQGRAVVTSGTRETMERDAAALHEFGLWATVEPQE